MERRHVLRALGGAGLSGLAGCSRAGVALGLRPPAFADVAVRGPDAVAVGEDFSVTVAATNTGGRTGDFTGTLRFSMGSVTRTAPVRIPAVAPGETKTTAVGPWHLGALGDATFRVVGRDATHAVTSNPATVAGGATVSLRGVDLAVTDVEYGGRYRDAAGRVHRPGPDEVFAYARVAADPASSSTSAPQRGAFRFRTRRGRREPVDRPLPAEKRAYAAGDGSTGWVPFTVPGAAVTATPRVAFAPHGTRTAAWSFSDVPTGVPRFAVRDVAFPPAFEVGTTESVAVVVANVGDAAGTYYGTLTRGEPSSTHAVASLSVAVPAGETRRASASVFVDEHRRYEFGVAPDGETATVHAEPPTLGVDEWFTVPDAWQVAMTDVFPAGDTLTYETETGRATHETAWDHRFLFVQLTVRNRTDDPLTLPANVPLTLPDGGRYENLFQTREPGRRFVSPVFGPQWRGVVDPQASVAAWLAYAVPADADLSYLRVHLPPQGGRGPERVPVTFAWNPDRE